MYKAFSVQRPGGGIPAHVLHDADTISQELVDRLVLLHDFEDSINEWYLIAGTLQVPNKLVEGLDGHLLLPAPPRCVLNEV
jgi:hypothetical protein